MSQYDGFGFEDENQGELTGKALREARDAAAKEAKDLKAELATLKGQLVERNLKDVLQGKSLDSRLARFMKADGIDGSDTAALDKWLTDNGDLIGYKAGEKSPEELGEPDARAAEFAKMQNVGANALPQGKFTESLAAIEKATAGTNNQGIINIDAVNAELRRLQAPGT